jgi:hypothetical protein
MCEKKSSQINSMLMKKIPKIQLRGLKQVSAQKFLSDVITRARENFIFKCLRVESMNYCFKSPPPKFQPKIPSRIAYFIKKVKQGFHRFIWKIKKLLISFNSKGMFGHSTLKFRLF